MSMTSDVPCFIHLAILWYSAPTGANAKLVNIDFEYFHTAEEFRVARWE